MLTRIIGWFGCKSRRFSCGMYYDNQSNEPIPDLLPRAILDQLHGDESPGPYDLVLLMPDLFDDAVMEKVEEEMDKRVGMKNGDVTIFLGMHDHV